MRRLLAGSVIATTVAGVPTALAYTAGGPRVPSFGSFGGLDSTYLPLEPILGVLALVAWVLWIYIALVVVLRAVAVVLARSTGSDAWLRSTDALTPKPLRRLVDLAVGGVFLAASLSVGRAAAGVPVLRAVAASAAITPYAGTVAESHPAPQERAYTVRVGDSLWRIAERELGSGFRWNEIYRLNRGHRFADGRYLRDPRLIHPGWTLKLPSLPEQRHHERADTPTKREPRSVERVSPVPPEVVPSPRRAPSPEAPTPTPTPSQRTVKTERPTPTPTPVDAVVDRPSPGPVVRLPSGVVVATSFACGLLSAELLTRLRRRRRRRPLASDDVVEMPERLVRDLRSAGAEPTTAPIDVAMDEVGVAWHASTQQWPRFLAAIEGRRSIEVLIEASEVSLPPTSGGRMSPQLRFERAGGVVKAELSGPFPVRLRRISTPMQRGLLVPLGHAGDKTALHVAPLGLGVLSVMGASAGELLRQMLLTQASESAVDDLQIMLLGVERDVALDLPHVTRTLGWDRGSETLQEIQAEFIRRARLFQQEDVEDIWSHLATHSDERLPAMLLVVADPPAAMRGLIEAVALEAPRFGGAVIALGWRPAASRLHVIADDDALRLETDLNVPGKLAPFVLDESAIQDAVQLIKQASIEDLEDDAEPESPPHEETAIEDSVTIELPHVEPLKESHPHIELPPRIETPKSVPPVGVPAVHCLGVFEVTRDGSSRVKGWQKKSKELLAYLIAHPDGASKERIIDELWPEAEPRQVQSLFDKALTIARRQVRGPDDLQMYFIRFEESWRLEAGSLWVDAFEFTRLVDEAEHAREATESVPLLRQAIALYRGNFCDDLSYPWAEPVRERFRNLFTRASARLAEILADAGENEEALEVLDRAIKVDVLCEDLWRRAMSVESSMGRRAAAADRYKRLRTLLATELNVEPDPETQRLERTIALRTTRSQEADQPSAMSTSNAG